MGLSFTSQASMITSSVFQVLTKAIVWRSPIPSSLPATQC